VQSLATSPIFVSWAVLFVVMCAGAAVLRECEWETARGSAVEWHAAYGEMIAEFEAHESATGIAGSSMRRDVEEALALLNAMGTCDSPPDAEADMDWTFRAAMLYVFYVCSTIGYGDMNVATPGGKAFVIAYSCVGMWVFGWASSHLSEALERSNSRAALWALTRWSDLKRAARRRRLKVGVEESEDGPAAKRDQWVAVLKAAFDACDSSGDGEIDVKELAALTKSVLGDDVMDDDDSGSGSGIDGEVLGKVLKTIDADRSGTIGFEEFRKLMFRLSPGGAGGGGVDTSVKSFVAALKNLIRVEAPVILAASLAFILISSLLIKWVEGADAGQGWLYIDVVWFMVISTTTIGLGDMSPDWNRELAATFEVALMAVGCVLMALAIGVLVEWYEHAAEKAESKLDLVVTKAKLGTVQKQVANKATEAPASPNPALDSALASHPVSLQPLQPLDPER
jgi:hypothetical protein